MYNVFDCAKAEGNACTLPFAWLARLASRVLTKVTGRVYDWDIAA